MKILIFSSSDIGQNFRLLHHAKSFALIENTSVLIFAPDISSLPKEIEKMNNIQHKYFEASFNFPIKQINFLFYPIYFIFCLIQLVVVPFKFSNIDFIIVSNKESFIFTFILAFLCSAKVIVDHSMMDENFINQYFPALRSLQRWMLSKAAYHVCSTKAMQILLRVKKIKKETLIVIHDPPGLQFVKRGKELKSNALELLGIKDQNTLLCGIPYSQMPIENIQKLLQVCLNLDRENINACFIIFANSKIEKQVNQEIEMHTFNHIKFKFISLYTDAYSYILSCCDFGIALNPTRYGLDFSPELTDMLGCHIPILAFRQGCANEVIKDGINGYIFRDDNELIKYLMSIFINRTIDLKKMKKEYQIQSWDEEWNAHLYFAIKL